MRDAFICLSAAMCIFAVLFPRETEAQSKLKVCLNSSSGAIFSAAKCPKGTTRLDLSKLTGAAGATGPTGAAGATGPSALGTLPSGTTVYGLIGGCTEGSGAGSFGEVLASLPARSAQVFDEESDVQVAVTNAIDTECSGFSCLTAEENDVASRCTGTPESPTAPAGLVCIYPTLSFNAHFLVGFNLVNGYSVPMANEPVPSAGAVGFGLGWESAATGSSCVRAVWAYTAP